MPIIYADFRLDYKLATLRSGHSEVLSHFFESFRFAAVQPESLEDNLALAVVQYLQKLAKFVAHVLVSEQLERRLRIFITDDLAKFG
jgi:predicted ribonuclease YlaK